MKTRRKSERHANRFRRWLDALIDKWRKRLIKFVRVSFGIIIIALGVGVIGWLSIASGFAWYVTAALCGAFVLAAVGDFTR